MQIRVALVLGLMSLAAHAQAVTLAQFNFNTLDGAGNTGTLAASVGAGTLTTVGGPTTFFGFANGSSDPEINAEDSAWGVGDFPDQGIASGTVGWQVASSTVGYQQVLLSLDQKNQPSSNKFYDVQVRTAPAGPFSSVATYGIPAADIWENSKTFDLTAVVPGAANNPNFAVQVVAVFEPGTSTYVASEAGYNGQISTLFDMITVTGNVPEPSGAALAAVGALGLLRRRRRV